MSTPTKTRQWILANHPHGTPTYSGSDATFKLVEKDLPSLQDRQLLLKTTHFSNDPAQRGWIDNYSDPSRLYRPPVKTGQPMATAMQLFEVLESKSEKYKKGDVCLSSRSWSEYDVASDKEVRGPLEELGGGLSKTHYIGALGATGLTAWYGTRVVVDTKPEDVVVVSGAAGAVGSMVVQLAAKIIGCKKVIGIAGGKEKCEWVKKLGAHDCIDYKTEGWQDALTKATPDYVNVYFDNVGGEILDFMFTRIKAHGRIAACGAIAGYNDTKDSKAGLKNWFEVIASKITIKGFIVTDFPQERWGEASDEWKKALQEGKLDLSGSETVVEASFEDVPKTWLKLFEGANQGKLITKLV